ncbi:MAG: STAS domain-containing protein [Methylococcaceae bacterium]
MKTEIYEEVIKLPASQTVETVKFLHDEIKHHFGRLGPIHVDASLIETIDTASLQLLAILFISARQRNKSITLHEPSQYFLTACRLLGISRLFGLPVS